MTAPQHNAQPKADQKASSELPASRKRSSANKGCSSSSYRQQRSWFMALGLLGGFGFVASQMSFAYAEGDFLVNDYALSSGLSSGLSSESATTDYSVADTTFTLSEPAPVAQPIPDAFTDLPSAELRSPTVAAESFTPTPAPAYVAPAPRPAPPVVAAPASAPPVQVAAPVAPSAPEPSITIEIEPAQSVQPVVTPVARPTFTTAKKPAPKKVARPHNRLAGMMEASALAAPFSHYVANNGTVVTAATATPEPTPISRSAAATLGVVEVSTRTAGTLVAAGDLAIEEPSGLAEGLAIDAAPVETAPAAVPDFLPEQIETAAPPIVEIEPVAEEIVPVRPSDIVPAALPEGTNLPEEYNSVFVDPTDYSVGATQSPDVVVSEQSTGCEFTVGGGQGVPNGACGDSLPSAPAPVAQGNQQAPAVSAPVANAPTDNAQAYYEQPPVASSGYSEPSVNVGPVSFSTSGIRFNSSTTAAGREYLNRSVRPLVNLQTAQQFIFPLAVPSPITSLFGFRIHPITGTQRFHAGTDIGAEQGTPVLAAQDGKVVTADYAGGYGLMVVLNHEIDDTELQSRYAHLSDILVDPGADVKKGDVIGLVGSTGNSTGPHLHFEMLQNTADGWVLVNADGLVQNSLANLVKALNNPMQAFKLSDLTLNLGSARQTPVPAQPGLAQQGVTDLPGQNGVPFRPAQPNAS